MWPNPQFPEDLVTFTKEILNRKLHFLCSVRLVRLQISMVVKIDRREKWKVSYMQVTSWEKVSDKIGHLRIH